MVINAFYVAPFRRSSEHLQGVTFIELERYKFIQTVLFVELFDRQCKLRIE